MTIQIGCSSTTRKRSDGSVHVIKIETGTMRGIFEKLPFCVRRIHSVQAWRMAVAAEGGGLSLSTVDASNSWRSGGLCRTKGRQIGVYDVSVDCW